MTGLSVLQLDFCGQRSSLSAGETLSFGRSADLSIDDNRFLHRVLGTFEYRNGCWWVSNVGTSLSFTVADVASTSFMKAAPGASLPMPFERAVLRFEAGGQSYEIELAVESAVVDEAVPDPFDGVDAIEMTTTTSSLPLTPEQRELLEALAAPLLAGEALPTNRALAASLGWTITKFNRKLDGLCTKYTKAGIRGLHGNSGQLANDRRLRLAEHVIDAGIVSGAVAGTGSDTGSDGSERG